MSFNDAREKLLEELRAEGYDCEPDGRTLTLTELKFLLRELAGGLDEVQSVYATLAELRRDVRECLGLDVFRGGFRSGELVAAVEAAFGSEQD